MLGVVALMVGLGMGIAAVRIALFGTGMALPAGPDAVEGRVGEGETVEVPAGAPLIYGEVKLTRPGSRAMEQSWSQLVGSPEVTVQTQGGQVQARLPTPDEWRGDVPVDVLERIETVEGLPVLGDIADEVRLRMQPPFTVLVRGLRAGDPILAERCGDTLMNVYVGERAELEQWLARRERDRWPVVVLLGAMALVSLALGVRGLRA